MEKIKKASFDIHYNSLLQQGSMDIETLTQIIKDYFHESISQGDKARTKQYYFVLAILDIMQTMKAPKKASAVFNLIDRINLPSGHRYENNESVPLYSALIAKLSLANNPHPLLFAIGLDHSPDWKIYFTGSLCSVSDELIKEFDKQVKQNFYQLFETKSTQNLNEVIKKLLSYMTNSGMDTPEQRLLFFKKLTGGILDAYREFNNSENMSLG